MNLLEQRLRYVVRLHAWLLFVSSDKRTYEESLSKTLLIIIIIIIIVIIIIAVAIAIAIAITITFTITIIIIDYFDNKINCPRQ